MLRRYVRDDHADIDHTGLTGVGSGVSSGTAFPGSPSDGDVFVRTDIDGGLLCTYDGTRWLGPVENVAWSFPGSLTPISTSPVGARIPVDGTYQLYVLACHLSMFVSTTNTAVHHWSFDLDWVDSANVETSLVTANTSADAASTWLRKTMAVNAALSTNARVLSITAAKI